MKTRVFITFLFVFAFVLPAFAKRHKKSSKKTNPAYQVLATGTQSGNMLARATALNALSGFKTPEVVKYAVDALHDPQWPVRKAAIMTLYRIGKKAEAIKALNESIADPTLPWKQDFSDIMMAFSTKDALRFVTSMLNNPKAQIKKDALSSLLNANKKWAKFVAKEVMKQQPDAINLAKEADSAQADLLMPFLYKTRDTTIANLVLDMSKNNNIPVPAKVLKRFGKLHDRALRGRVALLLAKASYSGSLLIIKDFAKATGPDAMTFLKVASLAPNKRFVPVIKKRFLNEKTPAKELTYTLTALSKVHDPDAGRFAATGVNSTDINVRIASVRTISLFQGGMALPTLKKVLFEGNLKVKIAAAKAMAVLARKKNVEILQRALNQAYDKDLKLAVIHALAKVKDVSVVDVLSYHVYDADPDIKRASLMAIAGIRAPKAAKLLRAFIEDPDPQVRKAVLQNLIAVTPKVALSNFDRIVDGLTVQDLRTMANHFGKAFAPFVTTALKSTVPFIRNAAFSLLNVIPTKERKALMEKMVSTSDQADVRAQALVATAVRSCKDACPLAQALLNDKDTNCKMTAIRVAGECCGKKAGGMLQTIMTGPADIVAVTAAAAYAEMPRRVPKAITPAQVKKWLYR